MQKISFLLLLFFTVFISRVFAGAALPERRAEMMKQAAQQRVMQQRQQVLEQQKEQILAERQRRMQEALAQQRAVQMQQQHTIQLRVQQNELAKKQHDAIVNKARSKAQQKAQDVMRQRNAENLRNFNFAKERRAVQEKALIEMRQQKKMIGEKQVVKAAVENSVLTAEAKVPEKEPFEVISMQQLWMAFDRTSESWPQIIDQDVKEATVTHYIEQYFEKGIVLKHPASHYVQMIDSMTQKNEDILNRPFEDILKTTAIIDYDFNNGVDKDALAKKLLGEKGFEENKKRLGLQ